MSSPYLTSAIRLSKRGLSSQAQKFSRFKYQENPFGRYSAKPKKQVARERTSMTEADPWASPWTSSYDAPNSGIIDDLLNDPDNRVVARRVDSRGQPSPLSRDNVSKAPPEAKVESSTTCPFVKSRLSRKLTRQASRSDTGRKEWCPDQIEKIESMFNKSQTRGESLASHGEENQRRGFAMALADRSTRLKNIDRLASPERS